MVGVMKAQAMEIDRVLVSEKECDLHLAMLQLWQDREGNKRQRFKYCERK